MKLLINCWVYRLSCSSLRASLSVELSANGYAAGNDDDNDKEVGVEWVCDYSEPRWNNLPWSDDDAESFYNKMVSEGFTGVFDYGDRYAWESDFEKASVGGNDDYYMDNVDFVYFSGHGNPSAFLFGKNYDHDDQYNYSVHYTEADWGDKDLEWIFLHACKVLQEYPTEWAPAFHSPKTLHGMTGFHTESPGTEQSSHLGEWFAELATGGWSIKNAWGNATVDTQPSWVYAAVYAVKVWYHPPPPQPEFERYYWNEHLPKVGDGMYSDPPNPQWGVTITIEYNK